MSQNDTGRHCKSCNKNVVDFAQLTDSKVIKYLSKNNSAKTCGRLGPHQLERIIKADFNKSKRNRFNQIITTLFLIGAAKSTVAQTQPSQHQTETLKSNNENLKSITDQQESKQDSVTQVIEGRVQNVLRDRNYGRSCSSFCQKELVEVLEMVHISELY